MEFLDEHYSLAEVTAEVGRGILFLIAACAWTFLFLMLVVD
jgi:hypothetical protein